MNCPKCDRLMLATNDGPCPLWECQRCQYAIPQVPSDFQSAQAKGPRAKKLTRPTSSMAEHPPCKRTIPGSSPGPGFTKPSKYGAVRTQFAGRTYASKAEARRAQELTLLRQGQKVDFWLEQVPFRLHCGATYRCDFLVFWVDGHVTVEDVKGFRTPVYRRSKQQVEDEYPVKIVEL